MTDTNYRNLLKLLGGEEDRRRLEVEGYMPLVVEKLGGGPLISLCHYGEQNGDAMRDPEVVFLVSDRDGTGKPLYFRNDYVGIEHATVEGHFGAVPVNPRLQKSLDQFVRAWWKNIEEQGFFELAQSLTKGARKEAGAPTAPGKDVADFLVRSEGSVWLFTPNTARAGEFARGELSLEPWQRVGRSFAVEHRLASQIARQLENEGFSLGGLVRTLRDYVVALTKGERHPAPHEHEGWDETLRRLKEREGAVQEVSKDVFERFHASAFTHFVGGPSLWHPGDESPSVLIFRDGDRHFARKLSSTEMEAVVRLARDEFAREMARDRDRGRDR